MGPILQPKASQYRPIPDFFQSRQILQDSQILSNIISSIPGIFGIDREARRVYPSGRGGGTGLGHTRVTINTPSPIIKKGS